MQLSTENYRTRWLILITAWTLAAFLLVSQARLLRDYLTVVGQLGLRGAPAASTPLREAYPAFAADAQTWVRHALTLLEGDQIQLRHTTIDNAPDGREVHWNSAWAWWIAGAGWIDHLFTGAPLANAVENATIWITPITLMGLIVLFSSWATRRAGAIVGVVIVAAMACNDRFYEGFFPAYVDHHGLLTVAVFGMVLGAVFMGGGWWRENIPGKPALLPNSIGAARSGAIFSALSGAFGMWVSAASVLPPIILVGAAGGLAMLIQGRRAQQNGEAYAPELWRTWGRVGALASFAFYLVEYFPTHLGFRLEANHPLYALGWLGGAELVAQFGERWLAAREDRWQNLPRVVWPIVAILAAPAVIAIGGVKVFLVLDPFLANLHKNYIQEFLPIWKTIRGFDPKMVYEVLFVENVPLIAAILTLTYKGRETPLVVWFAVIATALFNAMGWWQSRWLLNASGAQVCLAIVLLATWTASYRQRTRWAAALAMVALLFIPSGILRSLASIGDVKARRVSPKDANNMLFRDIAATLRASQPEGEIILLASPNASTSIGYYGRFKTLGTLYWENDAGLRAAGEIFSAPSEAAAGELIRKRHVTHIAMVSEENFIVQYYQLLHPEALAHPEAESNKVKQCFGYQILADRKIPQWLEMIPYAIPADLKALNVTVMLFKVNFNQNLAEALYHVAMAQVTSGAVDDGERTLDSLIKQAPQIYQPWLRKGELQFARHNWTEAAESTLRGISLAPASDRPGMYISYAANFYSSKQPALAIQIYRAGLAEKYTADLACYLAWVLATTPDDALRNGKEALQLAEFAIKSDPNSPSYLNTLAAALAENGRFAEASDAADRALANSRVKGDAPAVQAVFQQRLAVINSRKPLRE